MIRNLFTLLIALLALSASAIAQTVSGPNGYKVIDLGNNGTGDYTYSLILLHEMYNGTTLEYNNAIGTISAARGSSGSFNRIEVAYINTSSAYNATYGSTQSIYSDAAWKLKTCLYNGKKYLALDVPYTDAFQDRGFQFAGWTNSTGESMKCVNYKVNGQAVNQSILSNIQDFTPNLPESHDVPLMTVTGTLNVGTPLQTTSAYKLNVNGSVRANGIVVNTTGADFVFDQGYPLRSLGALEQYLKANHHLPEVPSASQMQQEGVELGELNKRLLQKVEELTLYLIEKDKKDARQQRQINRLQRQVRHLNKKKR